ncbi:MAG TPA: transporter [Verrucomicrobiae bacterium]|nr:transporter [Verrucomicrobiae bacterium]
MKATPVFAFALLLAPAPRCFAPPPLVTGDVPTADKQTFEWYVGGRYQENESGKPARLLPFTELVYGLTDRQELTFEFAGLSVGHEYGINDAVVGTKFVFLKETERRPGIAGSFELKLPTGDKDRGLGSGEFDYDLRLRAQKTWGWFTAIGNVGYTFVTDPEFGGVRQSAENEWLAAFGQEWQVARRTKLLSELYFVSREEPGGPNRLAANVGFKHKLLDNLSVHSAFGKSIRVGNRGGPDLHVYAGLKWEFDAPWKKRH